MKKIIVLIAIIGISFAGIKSANAQWSVEVPWNDAECNCDTIIEKKLFISITYLGPPPEPVVTNKYFNITNASNPFEATGDEIIKYDCLDCYLVEARIEFYDSGGLCCQGNNSDTFDSLELINGCSLPTVIMY